jgi:pyruvate dehydrogenase E2 component (dihydrolipoamide acetyltransferase)
MPINILMPALSPTMTEGNLARWLVKEGDEVHAGDIIAEIETDKATMEVESIDDGVVGRIVVPEGSEGIAVNATIAMLLTDDEDATALTEEAAPVAVPEPATALSTPAAPADGNGEISATPLAQRVAGQIGVDLNQVRGTGERGRIGLGDVEAAAGVAVPASPMRTGEDRILASPLARRMAAEAGIDLSRVGGSGPRGRIVKADIENASSAPPAAARPQARTASVAPPAESEVVKLSTMRRVIAERMTESKTTVPHFYLTVDCEIDELLKVRAELNTRIAPDKISVNDIVIRACALALREVPEANVSWEGDGGMMRRHAAVDVSVAVAIDGGLITPIVRSADTKGLVEIAQEMRDLAERARDGKLAPEEYQGGSFSISNLGMFGIKQFDAVINPPQAAILAVGAGEQRPVVKDGEIVPATVMTCTLSVDHRVVDGAIGARLLGAIKRYIEYPPAMLL